MNVLQNLVELYNHLPQDSTYRNVCGGILSHMEEAAAGTIYDLAELTSASRTTIWRMLQKMGYRNFSDFHFELKQAVKQYPFYNRLILPKYFKNASDAKERLLSQMDYAKRMMEEQVDAAEMEEAAKELLLADKVVFYSHYKLNGLLSLQQNLAMSGKETGYYGLFPEMIADSRNLTEDSIVILGIIEHAETMDLERVFQNCSGRGASIWGIFMANSRYRNYVDRELLNNEEGTVAAGILAAETYFILLSEIYRMYGIENK
ncbi:MAG: MurR/RpiR family transcriptional regulator [Lachnospiraceae bacterium]|jgi:DNA-binding MurR/RpiR family transcriptional regulator|nr:MurR/RpiR family transcriptional regulator [Lachnospiraceae bacterium]